MTQRTALSNSHAQAFINLGTLKKNLLWLQNEVAPAKVFMVIKANANGHGTMRVAEVAKMSGIRNFAVLLPKEALLIKRALSPGARVFTWHITPDCEDLPSLIENNIEIGIGAEWQLQYIASCVKKTMTCEVLSGYKPALIHLKLDTGLSRGGCGVKDWQNLVCLAQDFQEMGLIKITGFWSHLSNTSPEEDRRSLKIFTENVTPYLASYSRRARPIMHIAASVAALGLPESRLDYVRLGLSCFGYYEKEELKGVMTLVAPIIKFLPEQGRAIIACGFADGISPLAVRNNVPLTGRSNRARLIEVGPETSVIEICQDIDRRQDNLQNSYDHVPQDPFLNALRVSQNHVILFGSGGLSELTARQWAESCGTTIDDVLSRVKAELIYLE